MLHWTHSHDSRSAIKSSALHPGGRGDCNPGILVHPIEIPPPDVRGGDAPLVVEVADSSLNYDMNTKAPVYTAHGVREYWLINTGTLFTMVHRQPVARHGVP